MGCSRRVRRRDGLFGAELDVKSSLSGFRTCHFWLLHLVAPLEAERERGEASLEKEYKELQALWMNAKAEVRG